MCFKCVSSILLEGDHEKSFCRLVEGEEQTQVSEFADTRYYVPEMEQAGITKNNVLNLHKKLKPCIYYEFYSRSVLVTHGGLSNLPENLFFCRGQSDD
ncbi:MAG TPA: hypothetical protein VN414_12865 [Methanosarcina sp.]|nr:hypothetical protein [Methanosarcina sp.]